MAFVLSAKNPKLNNRKASRAVACLLAFAQSGGVESSRLPLEVHRIQAVGGNMFPPKILISIRRWENFFRSLLYVNNESADTSLSMAFGVGKPHFIDNHQATARTGAASAFFQ